MHSTMARMRVKTSRRAERRERWAAQKKNTGIKYVLTPMTRSESQLNSAPNLPTRFVSVGLVVVWVLWFGRKSSSATVNSTASIKHTAPRSQRGRWRAPAKAETFFGFELAG